MPLGFNLGGDVFGAGSAPNINPVSGASGGPVNYGPVNIGGLFGGTAGTASGGNFLPVVVGIGLLAALLLIKKR